MTETETKTPNQNSLLKAFEEKRLHRANETLIKAQRLVNIYRCLGAFPDSYIATYNEMLRSVDPETERLLSSILGGAVVRNYIDFLKNAANEAKTDASDASKKTEAPAHTGWLPTPESDTENYTETIASLADTHGQEAILQKIMQMIIKIHHDENEKQEHQLQNAIEEIQKKIGPIPGTPEMEARIQAFRAEQRQMLNEALEKMMRTQNDLLIEAFGKMQKNIPHMAAGEASSPSANTATPQTPETHIDIDVEPPVRPVYKG